MLNSPKSSFFRSTLLLVKCLDIVVIASMLLQSCASPFSPKTDVTNPNETGSQQVQDPEIQKLGDEGKQYSPPIYEHPEANLGVHTPLLQKTDSKNDKTNNSKSEKSTPKSPTASPKVTATAKSPTPIPTQLPTSIPDSSNVNKLPIISIPDPIADLDQATKTKSSERLRSQNSQSLSLSLDDNTIIAGGEHNQRSPRVIYNSTRNEYLALWIDEDSSPASIRGLRLTPDGEIIGEEFLIANQGVNTPTNLEVVYRPTYDSYLLIWDELNGGISSETYCSSGCLTRTHDKSNLYELPLAGDGLPSVPTAILITGDFNYRVCNCRI